MTVEFINFLFRWGHVLFGIVWIGMLYYFNFVQGGYFKEASPKVWLMPKPSWHQVRSGGSAGVQCSPLSPVSICCTCHLNVTEQLHYCRCCHGYIDGCQCLDGYLACTDALLWVL